MNAHSCWLSQNKFQMMKVDRAKKAGHERFLLDASVWEIEYSLLPIEFSPTSTFSIFASFQYMQDVMEIGYKYGKCSKKLRVRKCLQSSKRRANDAVAKLLLTPEAVLV